MKLVLAEPKYLIDSVSIISELVNEATMKVDKNKIDIIAMDPANVAMVAFSLLSSAFSEYKVDKTKEISINLEQFRQVLRRAKPGDVLSLEFNEEKNKLKVKISGETSRTFNLALIKIDEKEQKIPDLNFPLMITTSAIRFNEAIEDMGIISDALSLEAEKDKFVISASSNLHEANVELPADEHTSIENKQAKVSAKYSLEYLKKIAKAGKLSGHVAVYFGKDYPLMVEYKIVDKLVKK